MGEVFNMDDLSWLKRMIENLEEMSYSRERYDSTCSLIDVANSVINDVEVDDEIKRVVCLMNSTLYSSLAYMLENLFKDKEAAKLAYLHFCYMGDKVETFWRKED